MKINREVKIAFVFVVGIIVLIWGVNFLKGKSLFKSSQEFYAVYNKVEGLVPSNVVMINGLKVGKVEEISFMPDHSGEILVMFTVDKGFPVPEDTEARIVSEGIMGSRNLDLKVGKSNVLALDGDTLSSSVEESLKEEVSRQILPIKNKADELLGSIDKMVASLESVVNDSVEGINSTIIENLKKTSENLNNLTSDNGHLNLALADIKAVTGTLNDKRDEIDHVIDNFETISDSLTKIEFAQILAKANKTLEQTAAIMEKVNKGEGSLGMLVNNDSLYLGLEKSSKELAALLEDIKLNPRRYINLSVFGGKASKAPYQKPE